MFTLREKKTILYGYNAPLEISERITRHLAYAGIELYATIDRNAHKMEISACTFEEFEIKAVEDRSEYAFILDFMNANMHIDVAEMLHRHGFDNIIFLPFDGRFELQKAKYLRRVYNRLLYGHPDPDAALPTYRELIDCPYPDLIWDYGEYIEFWAPVDNLYIPTLLAENDVDEVFRISAFSDLPVMKYGYYTELLDYFCGGKYPTGYVVNNARGRDADVFLEDRKRVFEEMNRRLRYDGDYFTDSPLLVESREGGSFTLLDGYHRAFFLYKQGYRQVPVICERSGAMAYLRVDVEERKTSDKNDKSIPL